MIINVDKSKYTVKMEDIDTGAKIVVEKIENKAEVPLGIPITHAPSSQSESIQAKVPLGPITSVRKPQSVQIEANKIKIEH